MPNWVRNRLTIRGPQYKEVLHQITTFDNEEHKVVLDFNKITPMPESIAKMESSTRVPEYMNLFLNSINAKDCRDMFSLVALQRSVMADRVK